MLTVHNRLIPLKNYGAVDTPGMLFCRKGTTITADLIQHRRIHTRQMIELGLIFSYLFYVIERLIHPPMSGHAHLNISSERGAYRHMDDPNYLLNQRPHTWACYLRNPSKSRTKSSKKSN